MSIYTLLVVKCHVESRKGYLHGRPEKSAALAILACACVCIFNDDMSSSSEIQPHQKQQHVHQDVYTGPCQAADELWIAAYFV